MSKLNSTFLKYAAPIAKQYREAGKNWDWTAQAAALVKTILEESGNKEMAESAEDKEFRAEMVELVKQLNYPKNAHCVYLAKTPSGETDAEGKPVMMMPALGKNVVKVDDFV